MGKYLAESKILLKAVGSNENIKNINHCVTRMRFELVNIELVDVATIEGLNLVKGVVQQSGQFQVIIGNEVSMFYQDFLSLYQPSFIEEESKQKLNSLQWLMANLGGIFAPIIPAIICGGLVIGLKNIIDNVYFFKQGTQSLAQISPAINTLAELLGLIGNAVFFFMPVAIVWSIMKKLKGSEILGIVLGITLITPGLLTHYQQLSTLALGPLQWQVTGYASQVVPAILAGFTLAYLERLFRKLSPNSISMLIVPFFSITLAVIITHLFLGPVGSYLGDILTNGLNFLLTSPISYVVAVIFGGGYMYLVMSGMHHITTLLDLQLICSVGGTLLWPMIALANISQGSATLAMAFLQRKNKELQKTSLSACLTCYLGVSEPALFGVNKKYQFPFICALVGSALASLFALSHQTMAASIGIGGLPGIFSILPQYMPDYLLALLIAILVPLILTVIVGTIKLKEEEETLFVSPMNGTLMTLDEVEDQVFSQRLMGDGFAIDLNDKYVYTPINGEVVMTYPSNHAYGIKGQDGLEVLIHIGMDTVQLGGKGFKPLVKVGDYVKQGDPLVQVDIDYIKSQNKSLVSPVIITSGQKIKLNDIKTIQSLQENFIEIIKE